MRGDLCPYDHGTDPVVLEDVALSRVLTFGGPHGAGGQAPGTVPVAAAQNPPAGPNGNTPQQHLPLANLPPPHLRNQHHSNMGWCPKIHFFMAFLKGHSKTNLFHPHAYQLFLENFDKLPTTKIANKSAKFR